MFGGKFYFKPFIYVSIKMVYFYGIHKSNLPLFFCIKYSNSVLVYFKYSYFKKLIFKTQLFVIIIFGSGMIFYIISFLKQNFFFQYVHHLRHSSNFALFQGVCMDD